MRKCFFNSVLIGESFGNALAYNSPVICTQTLGAGWSSIFRLHEWQSSGT